VKIQFAHQLKGLVNTRRTLENDKLKCGEISTFQNHDAEKVTCFTALVNTSINMLYQ